MEHFHDSKRIQIYPATPQVLKNSLAVTFIRKSKSLWTSRQCLVTSTCRDWLHSKHSPCNLWSNTVWNRTPVGPLIIDLESKLVAWRTTKGLRIAQIPGLNETRRCLEVNVERWPVLLVCRRDSEVKKHAPPGSAMCFTITVMHGIRFKCKEASTGSPLDHGEWKFWILTCEMQGISQTSQNPAVQQSEGLKASWNNARSSLRYWFVHFLQVRKSNLLTGWRYHSRLETQPCRCVAKQLPTLIMRQIRLPCILYSDCLNGNCMALPIFSACACQIDVQSNGIHVNLQLSNCERPLYDLKCNHGLKVNSLWSKLFGMGQPWDATCFHPISTSWYANYQV